MEGEAIDFQDWEVLHKSEDIGPVVDSGNLLGIDSDSDGVIRSDYFSIDGQKRYAQVAEEVDVNEEDSVESDNPSWIDPAGETGCGRKNSSEFWSDTSSDRSEERKLSGFFGGSDVGSAEIVKSHVSFGGVGEIEAEHKRFGDFSFREGKGSDLDVINELKFVVNSKSQAGLQDFGQIQISEKCFSDSGGDGLMTDLASGNNAKMPDMSGRSNELDGELNSKDKLRREESSVDSKIVSVVEMKSDSKPDGEGEKRRMVWWKVPVEVLRYCVFRVGPVWSLSVAAAFVGFIILGRKLYKLKRKSQSLKLKVTVDDKKVSQFMNRAARLNEAFSVVRRVPIIRPALPASGVTPWPVMSMR
ncbi:hypothetical protein L6164_016741 [Bauhinia variegata]|uniref:Uncharacterized protein n=1 Tax=Bauhinia variegata TaxID=167791 RepID=A0ACB9N9B3_BAUVA|nr:hypothetical protein L6164_016741 [Bauhinia variegata]